MADLTISITKNISAPIEKVFDAWLDPSILTQFILPAPGMPQPEVENDAREGGRFTIVMQVGENKIPHSGTYLIIKRPQHLVFSWESPFSVDDSQVDIKFSSIDDQTTQVDLTHSKFADEESRDNHRGGWGVILDTLNDVF